MTMRMGASVGPGDCGPLRVPRKRRQSAGPLAFAALKPAEPRASSIADAASSVPGSLPSLISTTTPTMPLTPVHVHVAGNHPASLKVPEIVAAAAGASGGSSRTYKAALVPAYFLRLATIGDASVSRLGAAVSTSCRVAGVSGPTAGAGAGAGGGGGASRARLWRP